MTMRNGTRDAVLDLTRTLELSGSTTGTVEVSREALEELINSFSRHDVSVVSNHPPTPIQTPAELPKSSDIAGVALHMASIIAPDTAHQAFQLFERTFARGRSSRFNWYSETGVGYGWNDVNLVARSVPNEIMSIMNRVNQLTGLAFNGCLVIRYLGVSGYPDGLGLHQDTESMNVPGHPIVSVSVGAARTLQFRKGSNWSSELAGSVVMQSGDSLLFKPDQKGLFHGVVQAEGRRYVLSFRRVVVPSEGATRTPVTATRTTFQGTTTPIRFNGDISPRSSLLRAVRATRGNLVSRFAPRSTTSTSLMVPGASSPPLAAENNSPPAAVARPASPVRPPSSTPRPNDSSFIPLRSNLPPPPLLQPISWAETESLPSPLPPPPPPLPEIATYTRTPPPGLEPPHHPETHTRTPPPALEPPPHPETPLPPRVPRVLPPDFTLPEPTEDGYQSHPPPPPPQQTPPPQHQQTPPPQQNLPPPTQRTISPSPHSPQQNTPPPTQRTPPSEPRHWVIGDSMIKGVKFGRNVGCISFGGARISRLTAEIRAQQVRDNVNSVTVLVGTNDIDKKVRVRELFSDYSELLSVVGEKFPRARVFCVNILPRGDGDYARDIMRANRVLRELVFDHGYHWVACLEHFLEHCGCCINLNVYGRGRLHLNDNGKKSLRDIILYHIYNVTRSR